MMLNTMWRNLLEIISGKEIWIGVIIPLISALIGGGLTLWGVRITIKDQNKKEAEKQRLAVKPWLFNYDIIGKNNIKSINSYFMAINEQQSKTTKAKLIGILKNTDNALLILDKVKTENNTYYPITGELVEKDTPFQLVIHLADNRTENLEKMYLYVKDIYGNGYRYAMILDGNEFKLGKCEEV